MRGHMCARALILRFVARRNILVVPFLGAGINHGVVRIVRITKVVRAFFVCFFL